MKNYILDKATANLKLERMALEIAERNTDASHIVLAGIPDNGNIIAAKLLPLLQQTFNGTIDRVEVSLNKKYPQEVLVQPQMNFDDVVVILIDDVANRGTTMMYALKPFLEFHPQKIQTLVLVERSHKVFPVQPDYVGLSIATTLQEHIYVEVQEDEVTGAWLE